MEIYHRTLGQVSLKSSNPWIVEKDGKEIEVSKELLSFSKFVDYPKPRICVLIDGGNVEVLSSDSFLDLEIVDFDRLNISTSEKEKIFSEKQAKLSYYQTTYYGKSK